METGGVREGLSEKQCHLNKRPAGIEGQPFEFLWGSNPSGQKSPEAETEMGGIARRLERQESSGKVKGGVGKGRGRPRSCKSWKHLECMRRGLLGS